MEHLQSLGASLLLIQKYTYRSDLTPLSGSISLTPFRKLYVGTDGHTETRLNNMLEDFPL